MLYNLMDHKTSRFAGSRKERWQLQQRTRSLSKPHGLQGIIKKRANLLADTKGDRKELEENQIVINDDVPQL